MKKIGIFLGIDANAGGMFQYAESLLGALAKGAGVHWEVTVAYVSPSWEAILSKYPFATKSLALGTQGLFISNVLMAARLSVNLVRKLSAMCNPIVRQLASEGCDAWIFPAQDALTFQVEGTTIGTVHDLMHRYEPDFPEVSNNYRWYIREYRFRSIANTATRVLVDSEVGCDHVVESYGTSRRKIAPLPYIPPSHILNAQVPDDFDEKYILPEKFIFYPAQFWEHKNHKRLINAAASIRENYPDVTLVFSGGLGKSYQKVAAHVAEQNMAEHVQFVGFIPDEYLAGFYDRARAMVMPTFFGPTNIPPLEALVRGCPVAVSGIYAMPWQLGDAALYFDPNSVDEMAESLGRLWGDDALCEQLIQAGQTRVSMWGPSQFCDRFERILKSIF